MSAAVPWAIFLGGLLLAFLVGFTYLEGRALLHPELGYWTLSRTVATTGAKWPFFLFIVGHVSGGLVWGLAVHFFWSWATNPIPGGG